MRDVGDEAAAHGLVAFERRHVAQDPDGGRARSGRERPHRQLPGHLVFAPHDRVRRSPARDRLFERCEERAVSENLDEWPSGRVGSRSHGPEAPVRVDHPVLRVDDDDAVGKRLEDRVRETVLSFDARHRFEQRALHAAERGRQLEDLGGTALGCLPCEISAGDGEGRIGDLPDWTREAGDRDASDDDEQRAGREHGAAEDPLVLGLDLAQLRERDRQAEHGRA